MTQYLYDAFISYSHKDMTWGRWLQRKLETYRIPKEMRGERPAGQNLKIFRDQTDLAGVELQTALRKELDAARFLIVLCSPGSAASSWVNDEVKYFISLGRVDRIIPFIVAGEPRSEDPALECYPAALRSLTGFTHLGANVQEIGRGKAFLKLVSILLDVRFNRLVDRERQRRIRTGLAVGLTSAVILMGGSLLIWKNITVSRRNQELSFDIYGAAIVSLSQKDEFEPSDFEFLRTSAEAGNTQAMQLLADCYKYGWGTEQDFEKEFYWCRKGAEAGDTMCMNMLSNCYYTGEGTEADPGKSFYWDLQAAEAGDNAGIFGVAVSYEEGRGVPADPQKAFEWYHKSAEAGYDLGMYNLARCYLMGIGTDPNPAKAFFWTKKLAETGNKEGMYNLGRMYQYAYGTEEDPQAAYLWYRKSAEAGYADGARMAGWCRENNYGVGDPAQEWYDRAEELQGESEGQVR